MFEASPTPLDRLGKQCATCLRHPRQVAHEYTSCESCRELAFRALCNGNDAAWDVLVTQLWPFMLRWLYGAQPELSPTVAEAIGYRALWSFRRYCEQRSDLAVNFPTFPMLLTTLHQCLQQIFNDG